MNTAEHIISALVQHGVEHLFCLPGVQNDHFFDALHRSDGRLQPIHTRHEQGAAYMALGAALATGRPQAYCVVPGPGFLNTTAALATAYGLNAPVLALTGEIPSAHIGRGYGLLHEIPDQSGVLASLTKWQARIDTGGEAARKTRAAMEALANGRPRPVGLQVPMDVWAQPAGDEGPDGPVAPERPPLDESAIDRAAHLLGRAERPLIVVGGGAQHAAAPVRQIAAQLQAPVLSMRNGHGIMDARDPLAVTGPVGHQLWKDADVVLALGTRLQMQQMAWGTDDALEIVHVDIDPDEIDRHGAPALGIVADAADAAALLAERLAGENVERPSRVDELRALKANMQARVESALAPQMGFVHALRDALPEDGIFVDELTQVGYVSRFAFPVYAPRTFLSTGYQGTLGWGFPAALGAKVAKPDRPVVAIAGDGGFMFNLAELATAVRHDIQTVTVVFNDRAFGNVRRIQQQQFDGRTIASDLANPSFARIAEEFGALGLTAETPAELREAVTRGLDAARPVVVEVPVGEMPSPWEDFIILPRVRG